MKHNLFTFAAAAFLAALVFASGGYARAETVRVHDVAVAVRDKGLAAVPLGSYPATCLYAGMAELALAGGDPDDAAALYDILERIVRRDIQVSADNVICYEVGGQAMPLMALKAGQDRFKSPALASADKMWREQRRTAEGLMTAQNHRDAADKDGFWVDLLFVTTPYLLYSGLLSGNQEYVDFAAWETLEMYKILCDKSSGGLFHQARGIHGLDRDEISADCWSRGNGWGSMAFEALLRDYPKNGKYRKDIERAARQFYSAVLNCQDPDTGLWRQEMTWPDSYIEVSGSAQMLSGIGQAIQSGVLPRRNAMRAYRNGLAGLLGYVDPDGSVGHTCIGCLVPGHKGEKEAYARRQWMYDERHSFGPVVLALASALRLGIDEVDLTCPQGSLNDPDRPRAYCRFVSERKEDFAWENDINAFRVYSSRTQADKSLSGVDYWGKCVDYPIIDKWYDEALKGVKPYHVDAGEGCDFYVMGKSRGIGGSGVWVADSLVTPEEYCNWRIMSDGPQRADFRLDFQPYKAGDDVIYESKRIEMVCGTPFYKVTHTIESESGKDVTLAMGISSFDAPEVYRDSVGGKLAVIAKPLLQDGVSVSGTSNLPPMGDVWVVAAVMADPSALAGFASTSTDELLLLRVRSGEPVTYYVGCTWNGQIYRGVNPDRFSEPPALMVSDSWESLSKIYGL